MLSIILAVILALLLGIAFCFLGIRTFLVLLPVWAFFAGFWLGAVLTNYVLAQGFLGTATGIIAGLVVGGIFAALAYFKFPIGVALLTGVFAAAVANGILQALGVQSGALVAVAVLAVAALVVWILFRYEGDRIVIMVVTALGGASLLMLVPLLPLGRVTLEQLRNSGSIIAPVLNDSWLWILAWIVLAVAGFLVQWRTSRNYRFETHDLVTGWS